MKETWLVIDVSSLAHRAFHTMGGLSYQGIPTGVIYGVLAELLRLEGEFATANMAFCFDRRGSVRAKAEPTYKAKRREEWKKWDEEKQKSYRDLRKQVTQLRMKILKNIGYTNIFSQKGYEADDIIAACTKNLRKRNKRVIIVTGDKDMFQLIEEKYVSVYLPTPKEMWTWRRFLDTYYIPPTDWIRVKALAGCDSDEIGGIPGVGDATAIKFIRNELKPESVKYKSITSKTGRRIFKRNLKLVTLPFEGTKKCHPKIHPPVQGWSDTMKSLGIKTLHKELKYKERKHG